MPTFTASHGGLCVRDLERSLRFYCDGLGFEKAEVYEVGGDFGRALEVDGDVQVTSQFIRTAGMAIELLAYSSPGVHGTPSASRNQLGLTHLSFYVDDLEAAIAHLVACGGRVVDGTRTANEAIELIFLEDPDGTRVELMGAPAGGGA